VTDEKFVVDCEECGVTLVTGIGEWPTEDKAVTAAEIHQYTHDSLTPVHVREKDGFEEVDVVLTNGSRGSWEKRMVYTSLAFALLIGLVAAYYAAPYVGVAFALLLGFGTGLKADYDADEEEVAPELVEDSRTDAGDGGEG